MLRFISLILKLFFSGRKNLARQQIGNKSFQTSVRYLFQISQQMLNLTEIVVRSTGKMIRNRFMAKLNLAHSFMMVLEVISQKSAKIHRGEFFLSGF